MFEWCFFLQKAKEDNIRRRTLAAKAKQAAVAAAAKKREMAERVRTH